MRARSSVGSGAFSPPPASRLALVAVTCASVAFALVPGRPSLALGATDARVPSIEEDCGPSADAVPAADRALGETAEETEDESDESRSDVELDAIACEEAAHDWLPAWGATHVDVLHTHAPPAHAHVDGLERPPRIG